MSVMIAIQFLVLGSLVAASLSQQETPYKLTPDRIGQTNTFKLQCKDSNGILIPEAVFFRNGALNTSDSCFSELSDTGTGFIQVKLMSECDGRYMCGTHSGVGYVLSGPTEVYATPIVNDANVPDIQKEEGENVLIHCPFSESPLLEYQVSLQRNVEGVIDIKPTVANGDSANDLTLANVTSDDSGMYFCRLKDADSNIYNGPSFRLQVFTKFDQPQIASDITYSTTTAADDESVTTWFTIGATGTDPLSYSWTVNGTAYNATEEGSLLYQDTIPNGRTKVKVTVRNVKYDNTHYSDEQVLIIDKGILVSSSSVTPSCGAFSSSNSSGNANIALLVVAVVLLVVAGTAVMSTVILLWQKYRPTVRSKQNTEEPDSATPLSVNVGSDHRIKFDETSLTDLHLFLDKIDAILASTLVSIPKKNLNPIIPQKLREIKSITTKWNLQWDPPVAGDGTGQVPRGGHVNDKQFKSLLPQFYEWAEENFYEEIHN